MLLSFLLIASSDLPVEVPFTGRRRERSLNGGSHLMNTVRFRFQSEICDLKSEINMMVLKLARGVAVSTGGAHASNYTS